MMNHDITIAQQAGKRWTERESVRVNNVKSIKAGNITDIESKKRIQLRLDRLAETASREKAVRTIASQAVTDPGAARPVSLIETVGLERVIGKSEFLGMDFIELALAIARFVGRINIRNTAGRNIGFGTGFMVSPTLLLTNNHVLSSFEEASKSTVEFDYQVDRFNRLLPVVDFPLDPQTFFLTNVGLDYTLVAVHERSANGSELGRFGWCRLIGEEGKALLGDSLNIIQHPNGEPKQIVIRENQLVDLPSAFAHYVADTEPGSSGSPVFNDQWEVIALHHSGVPKMKNGQLIAKDGTIWKKGMDPDDLDWVANEGIRVSRLVDNIKNADLTAAQDALRDELLNLEPPHPLESAKLPPSTATYQAPSPGVFSWTIPLHVSISMGHPATGSAAVAQAPPPQLTPERPAAAPRTNGSSAVEQEKISIDPNYSNRKGYDPDFLKNGQHRVPMPELSKPMKEITSTNQQAASGQNKYVLPYHHFSVVMNKQRKLAWFTAVNIDGHNTHKIKRDTDRWFKDPRLDPEEQTLEEVYVSNPLDRGHLVRRLDPAWGKSEAVAKVANDDTFHFTNCSPQHADFNQNQETWAGLEDYILNNVDNKDLKVSVFNGPVFGKADPPYRGVRLPLQFWKVVVMNKQNGTLSATAYLLSQEALIDDMLEEFVFGAYKTFQVPIRRIAELTGLNFGNLSEFDPLESLQQEEAKKRSRKPLSALEDIQL